MDHLYATVSQSLHRTKTGTFLHLNKNLEQTYIGRSIDVETI